MRAQYNGSARRIHGPLGRGQANLADFVADRKLGTGTNRTGDEDEPQFLSGVSFADTVLHIPGDSRADKTR